MFDLLRELIHPEVVYDFMEYQSNNRLISDQLHVGPTLMTTTYEGLPFPIVKWKMGQCFSALGN